MTVEENLRLGAYVVRRPRQDGRGAGAGLLLLSRSCKEKRRQLSGTLSGGQLQMVCIGRGLMSSPKMIMLDEPSAALAPQVVLEIFRTIHRITRDGMTVLMVEQNVRMALLLAELRLRHQGRRHPHRGPGREADLRRQRAPVLSRRHGRQPRGAAVRLGGNCDGLLHRSRHHRPLDRHGLCAGRARHLADLSRASTSSISPTARSTCSAPSSA